MKPWRGYKDLPEMRVVPEAERSLVWRNFLQKHRSWREGLLAFTPFFVALLLFAGAVYHIGEQFQLPPFVRAIIFAPLAYAAAAGLSWLYLRLMRSPFRKHLKQHSDYADAKV